MNLKSRYFGLVTIMAAIAFLCQPKPAQALEDASLRQPPSSREIGSPEALALQIEAKANALLALRDPNLLSDIWDAYQQALEIWEASKEIPTARDAYLRIALDGLSQSHHMLGRFPVKEAPVLKILQNASRIAASPHSSARAHYLQGLYEEENHTEAFRLRSAGEHYAKALLLAEESQSPLFATIALRYAEWAARHGRNNRLPDGSMTTAPDFARALEIFRSLLTHDLANAPEAKAKAAQSISEITTPTLALAVKHTFHPGTEINAELTHRNLTELTLRLFPVDLINQADPARESLSRPWGLSVSPPITSVFEDTRPLSSAFPHETVTEILRPGVTPEPGAYLLQAKSGELESSTLLIVSESALVIQYSPDEALFFLTDSLTGAPRPNAPLKVWLKEYSSEDNERFSFFPLQTDDQGISRLSFPPRDPVFSQRRLYAVAGSPLNPVMLQATIQPDSPPNRPHWRAHAVAQQNNYLAGERIIWKAFIRRDSNNTKPRPTPLLLPYHIEDSTGKHLIDGQLSMTPQGTSQELLTLDPEAATGIAYVVIKETDGRPILRQPLFRILPANQQAANLSIELSEQSISEGGRGQVPVVRPGERLSGSLRAALQGEIPLAGANVNLRLWLEPLPDTPEPPQMPILPQTRFSLQLDSLGQTEFSIPEFPHTSVALRCYLIATLDDPEIGSTSTQLKILFLPREISYSLRSSQTVYSADQAPIVTVKAQDAIGRPVSGEHGDLRLLNLRWWESWIDSRGRQISGQEMRTLQANAGGWFFFGPNPRDFRLENEGYSSNTLETVSLHIAQDGSVQHRWRPLPPGYYTVEWSAADDPSANASTTFWVAPQNEEDIGFRSSKPLIISHPGPLQPADNLPILIATSPAQNWSLLTLGDQSIRLSRLFESNRPVLQHTLTIDTNLYPNSYLELFSVSGRKLHHTEHSLTLSQELNHLQLNLQSPQTNYQPGQQVELTILARDHLGAPVKDAEITLSLRDFYETQLATPSMAINLRDLPRPNILQTTSSLIQMPYFQPLATPQSNTPSSPPAPSEEMNSAFTARDSNDWSLPRTESLVTSAGPFPEASTHRPSAHWETSLLTNAEGTATFRMRLPDRLTTWKAKLWAMDSLGRYGQAEKLFDVHLPLLVKLKLPAFLREGDKVLALGEIHNNVNQSVQGEVTLSVSRPLQIKSPADSFPETFSINPQDDELRRWEIQAIAPGDAIVRLSAITEEVADALQEPLPVIARHTLPPYILTGRSAQASVNLQFNLPPFNTRNQPDTPGHLLLTSGLAPLLLDSIARAAIAPAHNLPEAHTHLLLPLWTSNRLEALGFPEGDVRPRLFNGLASNHPQAQSKGISNDVSRWKRLLQADLTDLLALQNRDGGWPWRPGNTSDPVCTQDALEKIFLAESLGLSIPPTTIESARAYIARRLASRDDSPDARALALMTLASNLEWNPKARPARFEGRAMIDLLRYTNTLSTSALAALALSAYHYGIEEESRRILTQLTTLAHSIECPANEPMLFWTDPALPWITPLETTSLVLRAMLRVSPEDPSCGHILNWILHNLQNPAYTHPRALYHAHRAMLAFLEKTGEIETDLNVKITLNDQFVQEIEIPFSEALSAIRPLALPSSALAAGTNRLSLIRPGTRGSLYYSLNIPIPLVDNPPSSRDQPISPFTLNRQLFAIRSTPTLLRGFTETYSPFDEQDYLIQGDALEVVLWLDNRRPTEKIYLACPIPAGFEADRRFSSKQITARRLKEDIAPSLLPPAGTNLAQWLADEKRFYPETCLWDAQWSPFRLDAYIAKLPEGLWILRYRLLARHAGEFAFPSASLQNTERPQEQADSTSSRLTVRERLP